MSRFSYVPTSFQRKNLSFSLAISDGKLVIRSKSIIFSIIYKKLLFIILIIFTSSQRFAKHIPFSYLVGRAVFQPSLQPVSPWICSFQKNVGNILKKTCYGYEFFLKELALRSNTKVHEKTKIHFCKPSSVSANLKLHCKPGIPSPEVLTIIQTAISFTKNKIGQDEPFGAVFLRTLQLTKYLISFRVCSSEVVHSSFDRINIFHLTMRKFLIYIRSNIRIPTRVKRFDYKVVERENLTQ